ncbi:MAG: YdcF family protein [Myxococcota bacterium]
MRIRTFFIGLVVCAVLWLAVAFGLDAWGQRDAPAGDWDAIVVAGCRVGPDGQPSTALARRVERAVALWTAKQAPVLVFTGGVGRYPPAEARVAADYAIQLGVDPDAIRTEERSTSTEGNAQHAAQLDASFREVLVVTDSYHVFRAQRVFGRYFERAAGVGSVGRVPDRTQGALREVAAIAYYALRGRL